MNLTPLCRIDLQQRGVYMLEAHVSLNGAQIGSVKVTEEGLYYRIQCQCQLPSKAMYKLIVHCGDVYEDLGLLMPNGNAFSLDKKVPRKKFKNAKMSFSAVLKGGKAENRFVKVASDAPFAYISQLTQARLENREGSIGVILPAEMQLPKSHSKRQ